MLTCGLGLWKCGLRVGYEEQMNTAILGCIYPELLNLC